MSDLCVLPHDSDRRALPGLRLCPGHRDRLERDVAELPSLHRDLEKALATTSQSGQRVSGTSTNPLPISDAVAECRHQIKHDLTWWVLDVARARGLVSLPEDTVAACSAWLVPHTDWLAAQDDTAPICPPVMHGLVGQAWGLIDPSRRLATGERCRLTPDDGERCNGAVSFIQRYDETWQARCSECGLQEAEPYLHERLSGRLVTIERVVLYVRRNHGLTVTNTTVRSWVHRQHVTAVEQDGATWYDLGSIQRYLSERGRMAG